jgi:hypothetical protein
MTASANQPPPLRRRWYESVFGGVMVVVPLLVLGLVAWRAYADLPAGVEWPWFVAVVPAGLAAAGALVETLTSTSVASQTARRNRYQFSLRGTLLFVMLIGLGLLAWRVYEEPYRQQRRVIALVERLGGQYAATSGPAWPQEFFGRLTFIDVADARPEDYLDSVVALPWLEILVVGGDDFAEEHLARLASLTSLRGLVLDSTNVSDKAIDDLRTSLPDLRVHRSQRRDRKRLGGDGHLEADLLDQEPWRLAKELDSEHFVVLLAARLPPGIVKADDALAVLRRMATVRSLALGTSNGVTNAGLEALAHSSNLESLYLPNTLVTDAGLKHLTGLRHLQSLNLTGNPQLTDPALEHVGQLSRLYDLNLAGTSVAGPGLEHLSGLTNLQTLTLQNTPVTGPGLGALRELPDLKRLDLQNTLVDDDGLAHLKLFQSVSDLDLSGTKVTGSGLQHLQSLPKLARLNLQRTLVDDDGLAHLKHLRSVFELDLSNTRISGPGLAHLAQLTKLLQINLQNCPIADDGLAAIDAWPGAAYLNLSDTKITDQGVRHLAGNKSCSGLDLSNTRITNAALDALANMDKLVSLTLTTTEIDDDGAAKLERIKSLQLLDCRGTNITADGKARLKQVLPKLRIQ